MKLMKYVLALTIAFCAIASAPKAQVVAVGGGSSALALELGQAAVVYEDSISGANTACIWTRKKANFVSGTTLNANDDRTGINKTEGGDVWVVWGKGTGTCASPTGTFNVYMYTNLDSVLGNRGFFMTNSSSVSGFLQNMVLASGDQNPATPDNILNVNPTSGHTFTDTVGGISSTVVSALNLSRWNWAGTDVRPEDALFATFRAEATCDNWIYRQPFDNILRSTQGLGYPDGTSIGDDFGAGKTFHVYNFAINGALDPYTSKASPNSAALPVGAVPVIVAVSPLTGGSGNGIYKATDVPGFVLANFLSGVLARASDLGGPDNYGVSALVREPVSGTYQVMEYGLVNSSQFHASMDQNNCSTGTPPTLHIVSANGASMEGGSVQGWRRRVIGTGQMVSTLQSGIEASHNPATQYIGYFFWGAGNVAGLTNVKYLTVNGVDPIKDSYTNGVLPASGATGDPCPTPGSPVGCGSIITFKGLNAGDYPIWSALRVIYNPGNAAVSTAMTNLVTAAQNLNSTQFDFVPLSKLNVWRSHYYMNAIGVNTAANGPNIAGGNDLCNPGVGALAEQGGDAGGAIITKKANSDFCADYNNNTGLVNKTE